MKKRDLKKQFASYPDVVSLPELCAMMGGIGDCTARKLLRSGRIKSIMIRSTYYIPKECIIEYLLSDHYKKYRQELKHVIGDSQIMKLKGDSK